MRGLHSTRLATSFDEPALLHLRPLSSLLDSSTAAAATPLIMAPTGLDGLDGGEWLGERLDEG